MKAKYCLKTDWDDSGRPVLIEDQFYVLLFIINYAQFYVLV